MPLFQQANSFSVQMAAIQSEKPFSIIKNMYLPQSPRDRFQMQKIGTDPYDMFTTHDRNYILCEKNSKNVS